MTKKPFAKALTKHVYTLGAPLLLILPGFVVGAIPWIITGWMWETILLGLVWFVFLRIKFEKDEYWFAYFVQALKENNHMEP